MKKFNRILMTMFAIASIGAFASCEKVETVDDGSGPINASPVGEWHLKTAYLNNSVVSADNLSFTLQFNNDGTGLVKDYGFVIPIEETQFSWTLSNDADHTLTITLYNGQQLNYTVIKLTNNEFNVTGTVIPFVGMEGDVKLFMTRNGGGSDNPQGDPAPYPGNTTWRNTTNTMVNYEGDSIQITLNSTLKFNQYGNGGSLNVSTNFQGLPISYGLNFTYTYNAETTSGVMTFTADGAAPANIDYTINTSANTITFSTVGLPIPAEYASYFTLPETIVFNKQ